MNSKETIENLKETIDLLIIKLASKISTDCDEEGIEFIFKWELYNYTVYLAASDAEISVKETDIIRELFDFDLDFLVRNKFISFEEPPCILRAAIRVDKKSHKDIKESVTKVVFTVYYYLTCVICGTERNSEDEITEEEHKTINKYYTMMLNYINKEFEKKYSLSDVIENYTDKNNTSNDENNTKFHKKDYITAPKKS